MMTTGGDDHDSDASTCEAAKCDVSGNEGADTLTKDVSRFPQLDTPTDFERPQVPSAAQPAGCGGSTPPPPSLFTAI